MSPDSSDHARSAAIEQLEALGLSAYAARTFVALVSLGQGTAKEVSEVSDVPRTRVYDAVKDLQEQGLVDVRNSTPREFWAISTETAGRRFEAEYRHRVSTLTEALDSLGTVRRTEEQRGVWTVTGRDAVADRVVEFVQSAEDEVVYMTVEELLTEGVVTQLRTASDRGVSIKLAGLSATVESDIREEIPGAETFESLWGWSETPAGRLLMVDGEKTLVSVLVEGEGDGASDSRGETAIWGTGEFNSLVVVLKVMFTWELGRESD